MLGTTPKEFMNLPLPFSVWDDNITSSTSTLL
jgi:hypothetical protein